MKGYIKGVLVVALSLVVAFGFHFAGLAASAIEDYYQAPGPEEVSALDIQGENGINYRIYYPSRLNDTSPYPVIVWGNGTWATYNDYDSILSHLASWGFVAIGNNVQYTGFGNEILDTILYLIAENDNPDSIFYGKIDVDRVGAAGHSQGAAGVLNAAYEYPQSSVIKALVALSYPAEIWANPDEHIADLSQINVPVFFARGNDLSDMIIIPRRTMQRFYNSLSEELGAVMGTVKGTNHIDIPHQALGYVTAWFHYLLKDDPGAALAFTGDCPEITANSRWANVAVKNLAPPDQPGEPGDPVEEENHDQPPATTVPDGDKPDPDNSVPPKDSSPGGQESKTVDLSPETALTLPESSGQPGPPPAALAALAAVFLSLALMWFRRLSSNPAADKSRELIAAGNGEEQLN